MTDIQVCRVTAIKERKILDMMTTGLIHSARKVKREPIVGVGAGYDLVIFGASESSCRAMVENMLRDKVPEGILCLGADSNPILTHNGIATGAIIFLPEVAFLNQGAFDFNANQSRWLRESDRHAGEQAAEGTRIFADVDTTERLYNSWYESFLEEYRGRVWVVEHKEAKLAHAITEKHIQAVLDRPDYRAKLFGKVKNESIVFDDFFALYGIQEITDVLNTAMMQNPGLRVTVTEKAMRKLFESTVWFVPLHPPVTRIEVTQPETYVIGD